MMLPSALGDAALGLGKDWSEDQRSQHGDWLARLDKEPGDIDLWVSQSPSPLLGKRFEHLILFWFQHSARFELKESNVQMMKYDRTEGEIDFIVTDLATGLTYVLEVACKYYLGVGKTSAWKGWVGPNGIDSLELKMRKFPQQLNRGQEYARDHGLQVTPRWMMKGYFFHHYSVLGRQRDPRWCDPGYNGGWYLRSTELEAISPGYKQWLVLPKSHWLSPYLGQEGEFELLNGKEMQGKMRSLVGEKGKSQLLVQVEIAGGTMKEISRGFVVPPTWPHHRD